MSNRIELKVDGMTCDHCKRAVENAVLKIDGVENVSVDLESGKAIITGEADPASVIQNIEDEGYLAHVYQS